MAELYEGKDEKIIGKFELIDRVSKKCERTKKDTEAVLNSYFDEVPVILSEGKSLKIRKHGVFSSKLRDAYTCRSPQTGDMIDVPASVKPKFKISKSLEKSINGR